MNCLTERAHIPDDNQRPKLSSALLNIFFSSVTTPAVMDYTFNNLSTSVPIGLAYLGITPYNTSMVQDIEVFHGSIY